MTRFPWLRALLLLLGTALVAGLMLGTVERLLAIFRALAPLSPWLAAVVVVLLAAALVGLFLLLANYLRLFRPRDRRTRSAPPPSTPEAAAAASLAALQAQVAQVQDEVMRRSLQAQSEELQARWEQRELRVVVFGTGSAGKTSLVNALLSSQVEGNAKLHPGPVAAPMGTTEVGTIYGPVTLQGLKQPVCVVDTPGILEAGQAGSLREDMARSLAADADLLLFVTDDDLPKTQYNALMTLSGMGKRLLVVLNKIDRLPRADVAALLDRLRQRLAGTVAPEDIVGAAARPAPLTLDTGETLVPSPKLSDLVQRAIAILQAEAEALMAANTLRRSQELNAVAREALDSQCQAQAEKVVERYQWLVAGVMAATPLPVVDLLATAAINAQMVVEIAQAYHCEIDREEGKELAASVAKTLSSLGMVKGAVKILGSVLSATVVGYALGAAVQAVAGAYLTRIAGKSFMEYFRRHRDWGEGGMAEVVRQQYQRERREETVKAFAREALQRAATWTLGDREPLPQDRKADDGW